MADSARALSVVEIVEEGGQSLQGLLLLVFDFDGKLDFHLHRSAQIGDGVEVGHEAD